MHSISINCTIFTTLRHKAEGLHIVQEMRAIINTTFQKSDTLPNIIKNLFLILNVTLYSLNQHTPRQHYIEARYKIRSNFPDILWQSNKTSRIHKQLGYLSASITTKIN